MKIMRSSSSRRLCSTSTSSMHCVLASRAAINSPVLPSKRVPAADGDCWLCATRKSHASGFSGTPWNGHVCTARNIASCTASSASCRCCEPSNPPARRQFSLPAAKQVLQQYRDCLTHSSALFCAIHQLLTMDTSRISMVPKTTWGCRRAARPLHRIRCFNGVVTAHHLSRLAEWSAVTLTLPFFFCITRPVFSTSPRRPPRKACSARRNTSQSSLHLFRTSVPRTASRSSRNKSMYCGIDLLFSLVGNLSTLINKAKI